MTDAIIKNAELTVKKYFAEKGYLNTEVDITYEKDTIPFMSHFNSGNFLLR